MVASIFATLGEIITEFVALIGELMTGVVTIFYVSPDGTLPAELTFIGVLALIGVGLSLFWLGFNFIKNMIKLRG